MAAGFGARIAAIPLTFTMIVAYATADREALTGILQDPDAFTSATPFLFLFASTIVALFGAGR